MSRHTNQSDSLSTLARRLQRAPLGIARRVGLRGGLALVAALLTVGALLAIQPPTLAASCFSALTYGDTVACSISTLGEEDTYTFSGTSGDVVRVRMSNAGSGPNPDIKFKRADGSTPSGCSATTTGSSRDLNCTLDTTETWSIVAADTGDNNTGNYGLHLQKLNGPTGATSITYGDTVSATIGELAELDAYTFSGTSRLLKKRSERRDRG